MKYCFYFFVLLLLACTNLKEASLPSVKKQHFAAPEVPAKNLILLIGDGMGLSQISAGMYRNGNFLNLQNFPVVGIQKPFAYDYLIADSGAAATAIATGVKTYNNAIAVGPDTLPRATILEQLARQQYATGLVVTSTIVHATPASFVAHVPDRHQYLAIAEQLIQSDIDFFVGGGLEYFRQAGKSGKPLLEEWHLRNMQIQTYESTALEDIKIDTTKRFGYFVSEIDPPKVSQGRKYLPPATSLALDYLAGKNQNHGFFLLVEGSQIDWGGHGNDMDYIIEEMIDFDRAVGRALEFAQADGETLVIVTADHETGGFAINPGSTAEEMIPGFTSKVHTGTLVPVFAYGPGAELFNGIYDNTDIYFRMLRALGLKAVNHP